jgi:hypothetical protein
VPGRSAQFRAQGRREGLASSIDDVRALQRFAGWLSQRNRRAAGDEPLPYGLPEWQRLNAREKPL